MTHLLDVYETGNQEITHGPIAHLLGFCQIVILYVNAMVMNLSIILCLKFTILCKNAMHSVLCKMWHFTDMWQILALPHDFTQTGGLSL